MLAYLPAVLFSIIPAWLFVGWPLAAMVGRRRRRASLRKLLGSGFSEGKSFVRWSVGIAVNDDAQEFAVVESKLAVICRAEDILNVEYGIQQNTYNQLTVETRNVELPRVTAYAFFAGVGRLAEVASRLKALQSASKSEAASEGTVNRVQTGAPEGLECAVRALAGAVARLAEAVQRSGPVNRSVVRAAKRQRSKGAYRNRATRRLDRSPR